MAPRSEPVNLVVYDVPLYRVERYLSREVPRYQQQNILYSCRSTADLYRIYSQFPSLIPTHCFLSSTVGSRGVSWGILT